MKRNLDNLGRLVIPKEMRKQLGIKDNEPANIECDGNKIIITKPDAVDYKAIVEEAIEYVKNTTDKNEKLGCTRLLADNQTNELLDILNGKTN